MEQQDVMWQLGHDIRHILLATARIENRINADLPVLRDQGQELGAPSQTQAEQAGQTNEKPDDFPKSQENKTDARPEQHACSEGMRQQAGPQSQTCAPVRPDLTFGQLVNALDMPPGLTQRELQYIQREQQLELWESDRELVNRTRELLQTRQFQNWFLGRRSCLLLADENDEVGATESGSAITLLCVRVLNRLREQARQDSSVVMLIFFCGVHADEEEGPALMVRSLIMQLLMALESRGALNLACLADTDERYLLRDLRNGSMPTLLHVFEGLLRQLPRHMTVYCVLDGVSEYENPAYGFCSAMLAVVDHLRVLARPRQAAEAYHVDVERGVGRHEGFLECCFKVLLTSANGTAETHSRVSKPEQHVGPWTDTIGFETLEDLAIVFLSAILLLQSLGS